MKKTKMTMMITLMMTMMMCLSSHLAFAATEVTIDLSTLSPETASVIMKAKQQSDRATSGSDKISVAAAEQATKWLEVGSGLGKALGAACKEMSIGVNDFIQTPVGKLTAIGILWKVVGKDWWRIVGSVLCWLVITTILIWSYRRVHIGIPVKDADGSKSYVARYEFSDSDRELASAIAHVAGFVVITIACMSLALY